MQLIMAYTKTRNINTLFSVSPERREELTRAAAEIVKKAHAGLPGGGICKIDGDELGIKTKAEAEFFWTTLCAMDNVRTIV